MRYCPRNRNQQIGSSQSKVQISIVIADDSELYREMLKMVVESTSER
jgi:hypothetical protein